MFVLKGSYKPLALVVTIIVARLQKESLDDKDDQCVCPSNI